VKALSRNPAHKKKTRNPRVIPAAPSANNQPVFVYVDGQPHFNLQNREIVKVLTRSKVSEFRKTRDPVVAIEAFLLARQARIAPPRSILNWIEESFQQWYEAQGKKSLDSVMGLRGGKGQVPVYKAALIRDRNEMLFSDMARLRCCLPGITLEEVAHAICARLENTPAWNQSQWKLAELDAQTLIRRYKSWPLRRLWEETLKGYCPGWSVEQKQRYLALFPPWVLPVRFRNNLPAAH